jgi:predicted HTH transcriptional regulator
MNIKSIKSIISSGESLSVEFKESKTKLNKDVYETVCAFSNRADELGNGVKNLYKYSKAYGGSDPMIAEGEVFRIEVQAPLESTQKTTKEKTLELLALDGKMTRESLANQIGVSANAIKQHISNLQAKDILKRQKA